MELIMFGLGKKKNSPESAADFFLYLIDDEEEISNFMETMLGSEFNCKFKKFITADSALDALKTETILPDLIISDVMMPGCSGFTLAALLKEEEIDVPIVFVTALAGEDVHDDSHTVLSKPFSKRQLVSEVSKILNSK